LNLWGSGSPIREFLFVDDLADAIIFLLKNHDGRETVNIGGGTRLTIKELATAVVEQIDPAIEVIFDSTSPDGAPARFLDNSVLDEMGWHPSTPFNVGLSRTIDWYRSNAG
jgi:GDP-L-fucose synthase